MNDDMMDLIVVFCILFVFMHVLYCFCVATEFLLLVQIVRWTDRSRVRIVGRAGPVAAPGGST